ncbi:response regulator transcription factor [Metasolibacillus meyeri]|uniref:Response regulator transcription factor n=1 Tax=Metasolibacillus meyeri TaxID=1071052 RepID=A0AAW9NRT5_9BACL|nr:response regulator transcription factor [Metasolibacillus meyeri]MEC1180255.1 response regulator transcription factor [Metasolibacillus meyeri]
MIKLLLVDDHPLILEGSKQIFGNAPDIIADTLVNVQAFPEVLAETQYDVFLLDINLGASNGLELAEQVRAKYPAAIVILYTGEKAEDYYSLIVEKKIDNVVSKTASKDTILRAVYAAINNEVLLPKNFIDYIQQYKPMKKKLQLNQREKRILKLIREGYTNKAIALELDLAQRTVESNLSQIYMLLNVNTRADAIIKSVELELI